MSKPTPAKLIREAVELVEAHGNVTAAANATGIPRSTLQGRYEKRGTMDLSVPERGKETFKHEEKGDTGVITAVSSTIRTLDAALKAANVDLEVWEVEKHTINKWDQGSSGDNGLTVVELWQVKVILKRRRPRRLDLALDIVLNKIVAGCPKPLKKTKQPRQHMADPHMLEISIFDAHFGKLAWRMETGQDFDLDIVQELYQHAVMDLLNKAKGFQIDRILFPVGQDFFHIDNWENLTAKGTPQDADGRWAKIFSTGIMAVCGAINEMRKVAPVDVIYVPGNHDPQTSWWLTKVVQAYYANDKKVTVDSRPTPRRYIEYGANMLCFTHGNEEKHSSLPAIMATGDPQMWARTKFREVHIGHFHKKKEVECVAVDEHQGVRIRVLPSLSGTDYWHYLKGFGGQRAAEAYVWNKRNGLAAVLNSPAKEICSD